MTQDALVYQDAPFAEWDAWDSDPPYADGLGPNAVIEVYDPKHHSALARIALRSLPVGFVGAGLWWRLVHA